MQQRRSGPTGGCLRSRRDSRSSPKAKPRTNPYTAIYARQGGQWLQSRIRDEPSEDSSAHEHLQELSWMLGEWENQSDEGIVLTTCKWSQDGNFLLREFDIKIEDKVALSGTQRMAWDPQQKQFRLDLWRQSEFLVA